jgi:hypothetical protein
MAQLMLSHHVMTDDEAFGWYETLQQYEQQGKFSVNGGDDDEENDDEENDFGKSQESNHGRCGRGGGSGSNRNILGFEPTSVNATKGEIVDAIWTRINHTLKPFFGLEITTVVIGGVRYHSMINTQQDEVVRLEETFAKRYNSHDRAFIRLLLNKFVEAGNDDDDEDQDEDDDDDGDVTEGLDIEHKKKNMTKKKKKVFALQRSVCINTRSELSNNFKLSMEQAGRVVDALLDDKYLQVAIENDDQNSDDGIVGSSQRRGRGRNGRSSRESASAQLELAPRAYLELSHVLTDDYGMNPHQLPQFLYHRD